MEQNQIALKVRFLPRVCFFVFISQDLWDQSIQDGIIEMHIFKNNNVAFVTKDDTSEIFTNDEAIEAYYKQQEETYYNLKDSLKYSSSIEDDPQQFEHDKIQLIIQSNLYKEISSQIRYYYDNNIFENYCGSHYYYFFNNNPDIQEVFITVPWLFDYCFYEEADEDFVLDNNGGDMPCDIEHENEYESDEDECDCYASYTPDQYKDINPWDWNLLKEGERRDCGTEWVLPNNTSEYYFTGGIVEKRNAKLIEKRNENTGEIRKFKEFTGESKIKFRVPKRDKDSNNRGYGNQEILFYFKYCPISIKNLRYCGFGDDECYRIYWFSCKDPDIERIVLNVLPGEKIPIVYNYEYENDIGYEKLRQKVRETIQTTPGYLCSMDMCDFSDGFPIQVIELDNYTLEDYKQYELNSIRNLFNTGELCVNDTKEKIRDVFHKYRVYEQIYNLL